MQLTDKYFKIEEERVHRFNYYKGIETIPYFYEYYIEEKK